MKSFCAYPFEDDHWLVGSPCGFTGFELLARLFQLIGGAYRCARQVFIIRLCRARLVTRKPMCLIVAIELGLCGRSNVNAHRSLVNTSYRHELQTQFPPSGIKLWDSPQFRLPGLHSVLIKAGARNPIATIATTISGHSTTNQKEIFQSEFVGVGFLFMLFSQAFENRHFT